MLVFSGQTATFTCSSGHRRNQPLFIFQELKRRNVIKVGIAYVVMAWLVMQVADVVLNNVEAPGWIFRVLLLFLAIGFPFAIFFAWAFELTPDGVKRESEVNDSQPELDKATTNEEFTAPEKSLAVLPFDDMSAERDQEHFCDGLTEELLNVFTSIPNLRVASRTSCFAFKGKSTDLPSIAGKLNVAHVLEGSVRKAGNKIRVTSQLIDVSTDSHLWSETYDRELDDIFAIQDDIASRILDVLKLKLGTKKLSDPTTQSVKAYEYFLRGRGFKMTSSEQDNDRAIKLFEKATVTDADFLRAWSALAESYALKAIFEDGGEAAERAAMQASDRAVLLQPDHPQSLLARGHAHLACRKFAEAKQDFLKVIERAPDIFEPYYHLARLEQHLGETYLSIKYFKKAMELNPDDYESPLMAIGSYQKADDQESMRHYARIGIERATQHLEDYPENPRPYYLGTTAFLVLDQPEQAQKWADAALSMAPDDPTTRYNLACYYALVGDTDRAFDLLENSIRSRSWIDTDPELRSLRDHPRYLELIESLPE